MDHITPRHDPAPSAEHGRHARRHVIVDAALLETAMRLTGRGQSATINEALAHLAELADRETVPAVLPEESVAGC